MKVFVSYSSADRTTAARIVFALRAAGHKVFFDRGDLPPAESFDRHIQGAIRSSHLLVFVVSPASIEEGRYTRTELKFAEQRWRNPSGRVLPVLATPTPIESIPPYLRVLTILEPVGDVAAEVVAEVGELATKRFRATLGKATVLALSLAAFVAWTNLVYLQPDDAGPLELNSHSIREPAGNRDVGDGLGAERKDVKKAINKHLVRSSPACFSPVFGIPVEFPVTLTTEVFSATNHAKLTALVTAEVLTATDVMKEPDGLLPYPKWIGSSEPREVPATEFALSSLGEQYLFESGGALAGGSQFCYGSARVREIIGYTVPADLNGRRVSEVSYTFVVEDIAKWARAEVVLGAFPSVRRFVESEGVPFEGRNMMVLTDRGWEVGF